MSRRSLAFTLLGAAVVGAVAAAAALFLLKSSDHSPAQARAAVHDGNRQVALVAERLQTATVMTDVVGGGRAAGAAISRIDSDLADAARVKDARFRETARQTLTADRAVLEAYAKITTLGDPTTTKWDAVDGALASSQVVLEQAAPAARRAPDGGLPVAPATTVATARTHLDEIVGHASRRLSHWRQRVSLVRRERGAQLRVFDSYADTFRSFTGQYSEMRTATANWIKDVDENGSTFEDAYDFLSHAYDDRQKIKNGLSNLDAPAELASPQTQVVTALGEALDAVDSASSGISQYQFDFNGEYSDYKDTPGWTDFKSASDRITSEYSSALSTWEQQLKSARSAILDRGLPRKPEV